MPFDPPTPGGVPDNPGEFGKTAKNTAKAAANMARSLGADPQRAAEIGARVGGDTQARIDSGSAFLSWGVGKGLGLISYFLRLLLKVRTTNPPAWNELSAAVLSEFLGIEIAPTQVAFGKGVDSSLGNARAIGDLLLRRLETEFTEGGKVTSTSGERGAKTFAGYGVNFGVQNGVISTLADALSDHLLGNIRELGQEAAQNIGLGRLVRSALRPLVDNTVAKPYDRTLRARYRQDHITEAQLVKALNRGKLTLGQVQDYLAQKGYPDDQIAELVAQLTAHLTDVEVNLLLRYGVIDEAAAVQMLVDEGWPEATARTKLKVLQTQKLDSIEGQYVNAWESICLDRRIDDQTFLDGLSNTHLSDVEKEWERRYVSIKRENPHTDPTLAQMQGFYADGIITLDDWDQFLKNKGYDAGDRFGNPDVQFWLTLEMLKKSADANAKAAKGKVKLLTIAQLTKAYKAGGITIQQLQDYLAGEGYGAADVFRLMAQIIGSAGTPNAKATAQALNAQADAADLAPDVTTSG